MEGRREEQPHLHPLTPELQLECCRSVTYRNRLRNYWNAFFSDHSKTVWCHFVGFNNISGVKGLGGNEGASCSPLEGC